MDLIRAGSTVYLTEIGGPHLWIILTDPVDDPPWVLAVPVNSRKKHSDTTVLLKPGDHPFIQWESCVSYTYAKEFRVDRLIKRMGQGKCELRGDLCGNILGRVQQGLRASPHTVKAILRRWDAHLPESDED